MAGRHGEFVWYELQTSDADAAQEFYSDVVGWKIADAEMPGMDYRTCSIAEGGVSGIMQLTPEMEQGGARPSWFGYVAVDDIDKAVESFSAADGKVYVPPSDIPQVGRFAMLTDPQGVPIYVICLLDDGGNAYDQAAVGHCAWNELTTSDYDAAIEFFGGEFGWERAQEMDMGALGHYQILSIGGQSHAGIMSTFEGGPPPMWRYYFRVPSLASAAEKIKGSGGSVILGPQQAPGNDEILVALDPQGAIFCLVAARD
jgi:predicted enzyme related to lactoylglutathione lyase